MSVKKLTLPNVAEPVTHDEIVAYATSKYQHATNEIMDAEAYVADLIKEGHISLRKKEAFNTVEAIIDQAKDSVDLLHNIHQRQAHHLHELRVARVKAYSTRTVN